MITKNKSKNFRLFSLMIVGLILLMVVVATIIGSCGFIGDHHHLIANECKDENSGTKCLNYDNTVNNIFKSHLPVVIIDVDQSNIKADSVWNEEKGYMTSSEIDPFAYGSMTIVDNENRINKLNDTPAMTSDIKIRLRGNSSLLFDKKQYLIKLIDENREKDPKNVFKMGEEWEWVLNISMADKSLLRNYMCMNIASEIMPNISDVKYCEVLFKNNDSYEYKGVYLLMESVKRDVNRVNISEYNENHSKFSYLIRRDRYDDNGIMLNNYGRVNDLASGYLEVKYPNKDDISKENIKKIEMEISEFEKAIYSNERQEYFRYSEFIDVKSFIDYFIINEFFANYDSGFHSEYFYKNSNGKLAVGPVWDFDRAMDNFNPSPVKMDSTAMHDAPWFRQLLRDEKFVEELIERYHELRKTVLSEKFLYKYIDDTIDFIGESRNRDWQRWSYFYEDPNVTDEAGVEVANVVITYDQEISKMKDFIRNHGGWMDENIDSLYQFVEFKDEFDDERILYKISQFTFGEDTSKWFKGIGALLFILAFIIAIVIIERE